MRKIPSSSKVEAAANALRVLRLLNEQGSVTVTEVSVALGVGKSTAHRILATLVAEGFATRDPVRKNYHPGSVLVDAGLSVLGRFDIRRRVHGPMTDLADRTGGTVKILILEGAYTRALEVADATSEPVRRGRVGEILGAHASAGGKMLLSGTDPELLNVRLGPKLKPLTQHTTTDWEELRIALALTRQRRWARSSEESTLGINGLAVPVRGYTGTVFAALSLAAPTDRLEPAQHHKHLHIMFETSQQVTSILRHEA